MNSNRKMEYFSETKLKNTNAAAINPKRLFRQEHDWSCALACIRTLLSRKYSEPASEDSYIKKYALTPRPYFSKDIKALGLLEGEQVIYGCDKEKETDFEYLVELMNEGFGVMVESMINYSHWMVLLGFYPLSGESKEECILVFYEPYYNEIRTVRLDEFESVWMDGDYRTTDVKNDFIAIKLS